MSILLMTIASFLPASDDAVDTLFLKVGSRPAATSKDSRRAVVLIHGLALQMFSKEKIIAAKVRTWEQSDSPLVKRLAQDADVYAFCYGQNVNVESIADHELLRKQLRELKSTGYQEIILVGYSAGGLIARYLVEDHPNLGVTRVIQICTPNCGCTLAGLKAARAPQHAFLDSLTKSTRNKILEERQAKRIPDSVEFACIVGTSRVGGDGIVVARSQWSPELQAQGVPAYGVRATHWEIMHSPRTVELLGKLINEKQSRWPTDKVVQTRKQLLGS